ncbi:hypothetical protein MASR2M18_02110 [Ignavibacteria bacterium]|jgi:hypothetical protein|nr:hypothetical protein [Bacteroidota bacterium]MCZ2132599.1 hypothetical protein [Bacteroidota bacterium]
MNNSAAPTAMRKAMRTLSATNFIAAVAFFVSYLFIGNWLYLLASGCALASSVGVLFFARFLQKKYFQNDR